MSWAATVTLLRRAGWITYGVWTALLLVISATLMAGHWVTLPRPDESDPAVARAFHELHPTGDASWLVVHVLYSQCRCSQRILDDLVSEGPNPSAFEVILLVGEHESFSRTARAAGFGVEVIDPVNLERRFHVQAAPLMVVLDPEGTLRYAGGYTERKQSLARRHREIVRQLQQGESAQRLPLLGCATSAELQRILDPLKIKYRNETSP